MSSSPPPATVKRLARTYGRSKPATEISALTLSHRPHSPLLSGSSLSKGSDASGEAPHLFQPSKFSPIEEENEERRGDGGGKDASSDFQWSWKAKMKQLDESEDDEEAGSVKKAVLSGEFINEGSKPTDPGPLFRGQRDGDILHSIASPSRDSSSPYQDHFSGSLSTLTPSSLGLSQKTLTSGSPSPTLFRKRISKHKRVVESDEESIQDKSSYPSSPVKHPINTPRSRSSTTPPTSESEHEMARKARHSSKGKSTVVAHPLVFQPALDADLPKTKGKRSQNNKVKAPTKKERRDTAVDRQRMNAEKQVIIPRAQRSSKLTFNNLLSKVVGNLSSYKQIPLKGEDSMDPISEFSSPSGNHSAVPADDPDRIDAKSPRNSGLELLKVSESDDEQLPDIAQLLREQRIKNLKEKKLLFVQQQQEQRRLYTGDEDELEIVDGPSTSIQAVIKKEAEARKSGRPGITLGTRILQKHAGISVSHRTTEVASASQARYAKELNEVLLKRVNAENARRIKEKSEEWVRRGGKPLDWEVQAPARHSLDWYAQTALQDSNKSKEDREGYYGEDDDDEDGEWLPSLRGSASPAPGERNSGDEREENEGHKEEKFEDDQDITIVNEDAEDDDVLNQGNLTHRRSVRTILNSDAEDEGNDEKPNRRRQLPKQILVEDSMILDQDSDKSSPVLQQAHRQSDSSYDAGATEDEGDKENNDRFMYDRSEDKENTAVVRHEMLNQRPAPGRQSSIFNLEQGLSSRLSVSSDDYVTDEDKENPRSPLKTLSMAEIEPITPATVPFATRLQRANSVVSIANEGPESRLKLSPESDHDRQVYGFSQFSEDGESFQPKKVGAGFSGFFDSNSQRPSSSTRPLLGSLKEPARSNDFFAKLRRSDSLTLTQDLGLQPPLQVDESLMRQADQVFEREQEMLLEAMNQSTNKKPELYINDQGFLTQTRPDGNVEVYRPPPTPSQPFSQNGQFATQTILSQSTTRQPFRELSMSRADSADDVFTQMNRLHRLRRRNVSQSPSRTIVLDRRSTSPPLPSLSRLAKAHRYVEPKIRKIRQRLEKSEFVEGEAQESDEDEIFGFRKAEEDEEEDGDHLDRTLETLVDDKEMDQTQIAEDKIMEKYQEHRQVDDAHVEEIAQKVVDGQFRYGKRTRDRAGIDNSDDDEEEDENNRRIRRKMKEPELRGDIKSLGKRVRSNFMSVETQEIRIAAQDETRAFAEQYQAIISSDGDPELAFLQGDDNDIILGANYEQNGDNDFAEENDENVVDRSDVMRQLRELAKSGETTGPAIDPDKLSFFDADDEYEEDLPRVRRVTSSNLRSRGSGVHRAEPFDLDSTENRKSELMINEQGRRQAEAYVKSENRRRMGTGRSSLGGISVVGSRTRAASRGPMTSKKPQPVKAAPSILKGLARRDFK